MNMPDVSNIAKDPARNITFNVMAYRTLTQPEVMMSIRYFRSTKAGKKLKNNTTYTIVSIIGYND
jgi:hypothetical protein